MTVKLKEEFHAPAFVWKLVIKFYLGQEVMEQRVHKAEGGDTRNPLPPPSSYADDPTTRGLQSPSVHTVDEDGMYVCMSDHCHVGVHLMTRSGLLGEALHHKLLPQSYRVSYVGPTWLTSRVLA